MAGVDPVMRRKNADLPTRAASALVMLAVAGTALWLGGMFWDIFVLTVAIGIWFEWRGLVLRFAASGLARNLWLAAGAIWCGLAGAVLLALREGPLGLPLVLTVLLSVAATDTGAYFAGRTFGGPKIAPRISPSKTWAGLAGGLLFAPLALFLGFALIAQAADAAGAEDWRVSPFAVIVAGWLVAVTAQAGDFFQSWMKRRAGVKDSGNLLPGHGGLFDRCDGLLAVLLLLGIALSLQWLKGVL